MPDKIKDMLSDFLKMYKTEKHAYRYFLNNFLIAVCDRFHCEDLLDIGLPEITEFFEAYCKKKDYKPNTVRSFRYGLKAFLSFAGFEIGPYTLLSPVWKERSTIISESEFRSFINAVRAVCKRDEKDEVVLVSCLSYYMGLSMSEILKLHTGSFYKSGSAYAVKVESGTEKKKDRVLEIPKMMEKELVAVLSKKSSPLFTFGRKENASKDPARDPVKELVNIKRKLQRKIEEAAALISEDTSRYSLKAFRSSRIYSDIMSGVPRKTIIDTYGVSKYYISNITREKEDKLQ